MTDKQPLPILAKHRKDQGKTQADLAGELEVAVMTVSRWETGDRKIGLKTLSKVSEKTGIPKRELRPDLATSMEEAAE